MSKSRWVKCIETGVVYHSVKSACEETGADSKTLRGAIETPRRTAKGFHWEDVKVEKIEKFKRIKKKKDGKTVGTYTGNFPNSESGFIDQGKFYNDKYRLFDHVSENDFFNLKICLIPPRRERKGNFHLSIKVNMDVGEIKIYKSKDALIMVDKYPALYKSLEKYLKEVYL
jgi:hypothetical protein